MSRNKITDADTIKCLNQIVIYCKGDWGEIFNLIHQHTPPEIFGKLKLYGPQYEKGGKQYKAVYNWRKWKEIRILETRFRQYVSEELINSFVAAASVEAPPSTAASIEAPPSTAAGGVPATPLAIAGAAGASLGYDAMQLFTPGHNNNRDDVWQALGGLIFHGQQTNHQVSTLTTQATKFQARTEGRLNEQEDRIQKIENIVPVNLMERIENLENQKKSNNRVLFGTRNEYFEIPPRGSEKKLKPALKERTPTQPSTRSTRSRSAQGSTPVRMSTRSSSRKNEK